MRYLRKNYNSVKNILIFIAATMLVNACGKKETKVLISTNMGDITIKLYDKRAKLRALYFIVLSRGL